MGQYSQDDTSPASNAEEITPHDTNLVTTTRALYVGTGGNVKVEMLDIDGGSAVSFLNVPDGTLLPLRVIRVHATGTTASDIVGLW